MHNVYLLCAALSRTSFGAQKDKHRRNPEPSKIALVWATYLLIARLPGTSLVSPACGKFQITRCRRQTLVSWVLFEGSLVGSVTRWPLREGG